MSRSKRGEWNSYLTDADQYKLSKNEILEKKKLFISKNNLVVTSSLSTVTKQKGKTSSFRKKTDFRREESKSSSGIHRSSPFTIISSSAGTTQSANSDEDESVAGTESDDCLSNCDDLKDLSSLDLLEQSCDQSCDQKIPNRILQKQKTTVEKITKEPLKNLSKNLQIKESVQIIGKCRSIDGQRSSGYATQSPRVEYTQTFATQERKEPVEIDGNYLIEMVQEIQTLRTELRYYEQLSGRKSILNGEELDAVLDISNIHRQSAVNHRQILKYLVELICQTMTYLLRSEVELQSQKSKYDVLSTRLDSLTAFVSSLSLDSAIYSNKEGGTTTTTTPSSSFHNAPLSPANASMHDLSDHMSAALQRMDTQQKPTPNRELIPIRLFQSPIPAALPGSAAPQVATGAQPLFEDREAFESEQSHLQTHYDHYLSLAERVTTQPLTTGSLTSSASTLQLKYDTKEKEKETPTQYSIDSTIHTIPYASAKTKLNPTMTTRFTPASASAVASPPQSSSLPLSQQGLPYGYPPHSDHLLSSGTSQNNMTFSGTSTTDWLFSPPPPPPPPLAPPPSAEVNGAAKFPLSKPFGDQVSTRSNALSNTFLLSPNYSFGPTMGEHTASSPGDIKKNLFPEHDLSTDSHVESLGRNDYYMQQMKAMNPPRSSGGGSGNGNSEYPSLIAPNQLSSLPLPQSFPQHPYAFTTSYTASLSTTMSTNRTSPDSIAVPSPATATTYPPAAVIQTLLSPHWGKDSGRVFDARLGSF